MRLAHIGPFPPFRGGIAQFTSMLTEALSTEAEVVRVTYSRLYPRALFPGRSQYEPGIEPPVPVEPSLDSLDPRSWRRVRKALSASAPDGVIVEWWHPFFAPALSRSLPPAGPTRRLAVCHNLYPHEGFPLARRIAAGFLRGMDRVVVHSAEDEDGASGLGIPSDRVIRLFHPIYDQYIRPRPDRREAREALGYPDDAVVILFFGLVRPYKGLEDLVKALGILADPRVRLLAAGECYGGRGALDEAIERSPVRGSIRWIDEFVPQDSVATYFRAADLVALPYRSATQSGVAQIALSFGKPLVLTRTGGLPELVEEGVTGFLAEPCSPDSLSAALASAIGLLDDPALGSRVAGVAARFSWRTYADAVLEALG